VPPPPLIHGLGENITTHWAPSLKHREKHLPDPAEWSDQWHDFEEHLKVEARKKAQAAAAARPVQVPAGPKPAAPPPQRPSAVTPAVPKVASRDDATPPPTRNPLLAKKPAAEATGDDDAPGRGDGGSVQVDGEVMAEAVEPDGDGTNIKAYPSAPRRPGSLHPRPAAAPARPSAVRAVPPPKR